MNLTNLSTSPGKPSASLDRIDHLFAHFLTMFGSEWIDKWTGVPISTVKSDWRAGLASYTDEALRLAWESMLRDAWKFPPNLSEFSSLCRQFERRGPHLMALPNKRRGPPPPGGFETLRSALRRTKCPE